MSPNQHDPDLHNHPSTVSTDHIVNSIRDLQLELIDTCSQIKSSRNGRQHLPLEKRPEFSRLLEIGKRLHLLGGFNAMSDAMELIEGDKKLRKASIARFLDMAWDGIGAWQA